MFSFNFWSVYLRIDFEFYIVEFVDDIVYLVTDDGLGDFVFILSRVFYRVFGYVIESNDVF